MDVWGRGGSSSGGEVGLVSHWGTILSSYPHLLSLGTVTKGMRAAAPLGLAGLGQLLSSQPAHPQATKK